MSSNILLVTDIFGNCTALQPLLQDITAAGTAVTIIDPYQGGEQSFVDETAAYQAYSSNGGHDAYAACIAQALAQPYTLALGFSAGATALWRGLAAADAGQITQAVLFYPGQIHQHLAVRPKLPVQVIFGHSEPHFAVAAICTELSKKPGITAVQTACGHGFMNPASKAFDSEGYQQCFTRFIQCHIAAAKSNSLA
ncbi:MAG TPA: dienelactone hydrolase family protein [Rheinheimera sp.]|uniref:dienelactone hydrolase family protein n=1 Tax=Rheinheimera sp. TaxID=1869214 RepID=UPI002F9404C9